MNVKALSLTLLSAAYSMSGHIKITLSSVSTLLDRRRAVHVLLQSLAITFEGQSELVTEETGYSAFRLCSISKELVVGDPVELNNEETEGLVVVSTWNVVFSLTIPGWLPASSPFGDTGGGTCYGLYASAVVEHLDDPTERTWLSTLCSSFYSPLKTLRAQAPIVLNRYVSPSMIASSSASTFPSIHFAVKAQAEPNEVSSAFPQEVLAKILVQVSVPEKINLDEDTLPLTLRLRTDNLSQSERAKLRAASFAVDVEQIERYRCVSSRPVSSCNRFN